jgi:hypothetical protein
MAKATKSIPKDQKKSSPKNRLKEMVKQSLQPPPKAITLPEKSLRKKGNKKSG